MNIVFISYWGINDPLSVATVLPHVKILAEMPHVKKIFLLSFERGQISETDLPSCVEHRTIIEKQFPPVINKFLSFFSGWRLLKKIHKNNNIDYCFCRSSFAGILGYHLKKKYKVPFLVESLEPHTDYMIESGEWRKNGLKSIILRKYEKAIFKKANYLLPVSQNYINRLIKLKISESKLKLLPCTIDVNKFKFDLASRERLRKLNNFGVNDIVGVYVGKFGGIYYDKQAFELFRFFKTSIDNFKLIILSPNDREEVEGELYSAGFEDVDFTIKKVSPAEVPSYLSMSDFGIAIYRESAFSNCLSPIKVGEYLVNGLPVVLPERIGDDSEIIKSHGIGDLFTFSSGALSLELSILKIIKNKDSRAMISEIGVKYRNRNISLEVYQNILA